jgi:hypothetical protein
MAPEIVVGVFADRDAAHRAIDALVAAGFREDSIGYAVRHESPADATHEGSHAPAPPADVADLASVEGPAGGAATGAITGGVLGGLIAAAAALFVPGIGPVLAGGILASAVSGAAIGAAAGGLLGTLVGLGVPEEEAAKLEEEIHAGRAIITVRSTRPTEAREVIERHGGYISGRSM